MNQASPITRKSECLSHCSNSHTVKHNVLNRQKEEDRKGNRQRDVGGGSGEVGVWSIDHRWDENTSGFLKFIRLAMRACYILHRLMLYNVTRWSMGRDSVSICENVHALQCMFTFYMNIIIIFPNFLVIL